MAKLKKDEAATLDQDAVRCAEGYSLADGAPATYIITCDDADPESPDTGLLTCTDCPQCYPMCPENPDNINKFISGTDMVFSQLTVAELKKGETATLNHDAVKCADGHSLAFGAPEAYTITCGDADPGAPDTGLLGCTECPQCYAKCPENPDNVNKFVSGTDIAVSQLIMAELKKDESVSLNQDAVTCADTHSLAEGAPESYTITCGDADDGKDPDTGLLSCSSCPKCYPKCPANPNSADSFAAGTDISFALIEMAEMKKGGIVTLDQDKVECAEGHSLAVGAPAAYTITCGDANSDAPNTGLLSCTECPKCYQQCLANPTEEHLDIPEDKGVISLTIADNQKFGSAITVDKSDIVCKAGFAMSNEAADTFTFQCGASGKFTCTDDDCPICEKACDWPTEADGVNYQYVGGSKNNGERAEYAIRGRDHIEAYCEDSSMSLLGPRYLSCLADNTIRFDTTGYPDDQKATCQSDVSVCEAPKVNGGTLQNTGNLAVGEDYIVTCNEGKVFDLETKQVYDSPNTANVKCVKQDDDTIINTNLTALHCYSGCSSVSEFSGTTDPEPTKSGGAPYSEGQVITFECQPDCKLESTSERQQTCTNGKISKIPKCICEDYHVEAAIKPKASDSASSSISLYLSIFTILQLILWTF